LTVILTVLNSLLSNWKRQTCTGGIKTFLSCCNIQDLFETDKDFRSWLCWVCDTVYNYLSTFQL